MKQSVDRVLGIRTWGGGLVGADESTELWRPSLVFRVRKKRRKKIVGFRKLEKVRSDVDDDSNYNYNSCMTGLTKDKRLSNLKYAPNLFQKTILNQSSIFGF